MTEVSIVVPVYNEEENLAQLHSEICEVCEREGYDYEILLVDDGSTDITAEVARTLTPLKLIVLRKNFGQTAAMDAGIKQAQYGYIVTMDGDLQNNPDDIPRLINVLEDGNYDVVSGWRKNRKDSASKRFASRGANFLRGILIKDGIHDSGCSLKIYRKECFNDVNLYGEMHRFIPALLKTKGFRIGEIVVDHRPRIAGKTKYNWKRTFKGLVDMVSVWFWNKYAMRPLHLFGSIGIILILLGVLCAVWTVVLFIAGEDLSDNFQPIVTISLLGGGLFFFVFGLMSDILVRIYFGNKIDSPYNIKSIEKY